MEFVALWMRKHLREGDPDAKITHKVFLCDPQKKECNVRIRVLRARSKEAQVQINMLWKKADL
jgi:hypothetical protein